MQVQIGVLKKEIEMKGSAVSPAKRKRHHHEDDEFLVPPTPQKQEFPTLQDLCLYQIVSHFKGCDEGSFKMFLGAVQHHNVIRQLLLETWKEQEETGSLDQQYHVVTGARIVLNVRTTKQFKKNNQVVTSHTHETTVPIVNAELQSPLLVGLLNKMGVKVDRSKIHRTERFVLY